MNIMPKQPRKKRVQSIHLLQQPSHKDEAQTSSPILPHCTQFVGGGEDVPQIILGLVELVRIIHILESKCAKRLPVYTETRRYVWWEVT